MAALTHCDAIQGIPENVKKDTQDVEVVRVTRLCILVLKPRMSMVTMVIGCGRWNERWDISV